LVCGSWSTWASFKIRPGSWQGLHCSNAIQNLLRLERIADSVAAEHDRMIRTAQPPAAPSMNLEGVRALLEQIRAARSDMN